jgi:hypothetical protein
LLRTGVPAPFERDFGSSVEHRGELASDVERSGRKRRPEHEDPATGGAPGRDSQADTDGAEDAFDDGDGS